jgi:hypothetical protein
MVSKLGEGLRSKLQQQLMKETKQPSEIASNKNLEALGRIFRNQV